MSDDHQRRVRRALARFIVWMKPPDVGIENDFDAADMLESVYNNDPYSEWDNEK